MVAELRAREFTAETLTAWGLTHLRADAELIVTELVHGALLGLALPEVSPAAVRVRLRMSGRSLVIEVEDPLMKWLPEVYDGGLTGKICNLWGVRPSSVGKVVWVWLANGEDKVGIYCSGPPWPASGEPWQEQQPGSG